MKSTFSNTHLFLFLVTIFLSIHTMNAMEKRPSQNERTNYESRLKTFAERILQSELEFERMERSYKIQLAEARSGHAQSARELESQREAFETQLAELKKEKDALSQFASLGAAYLAKLAREATNPS